MRAHKFFIDEKDKRPHGLPWPLIVSLTSYPRRFANLAKSIVFLLNQTVQPDEVVLWVAHDDKPDLPQDVKDLKSRGLKIRTCKDLRSYKKFVPSLLKLKRQQRKAAIVTADDDLFYGRFWLQDLVDTYKQEGGIVCHRAHGILFDRNKFPLPYNDWEYQVTEPCSSYRLFPTSGAGVLYPPGSLAPEVLNEKDFMRLAPTTDDVWLYVMGARAKSVVTKVEAPQKLITILGSQNYRLWDGNRLGPNDDAFHAVTERYPLPAWVRREPIRFKRTGVTINRILRDNPAAYG